MKLFVENIKRLALLFAATLCCCGVWAIKTIYLNTGGTSLWEASSPVFYVWAFSGTTSGDNGFAMTLVEENIYSVEINDDYKSIIFVRCKTGSTSWSWNNKWNQTADLTIPTDGKNCYKITAWDAVGSWTTYTPPTAVTYNVTVTNGTASTATVAEGGSVTLTANDAADCQQFTGWNITGATVSDLTQNPLIISDIQGDITATASYESISLPTSVSMTLSANTITQGKSISITANSTPEVSGVSYAYQYKKSGASSWTDASSATLTLSDVGTYTVRVVAKVSGCTTEIASEEQTVTVEAGVSTRIHVKFPSDWLSSYSNPAIHHWTNNDGIEGAMTYEFDDTDGGKWYVFDIPYGRTGFLVKTSGNWTWKTSDMTTPSEETCYSVVKDNSKGATQIDCPEPPTYYTVSVTNGTASSATVAEGGNVTLTANEAADCQQFTGWNITGATVSDHTQNPLTISNVTSNITATANYENISLPTSVSMTLSANTITQGKSISITANSTPEVSGVSYTYQYKKSDASSWTDGSSSLSLNDVGTYTVRVVAKVSGCTTEIASEEQTVTVEAGVPTRIHVKFPSDWLSSYSNPAIWHWTSGDGVALAMTYEFDADDGGKWYVAEIPFGRTYFLVKNNANGTFDWKTSDIKTPSEETCYSVVKDKNKDATQIDCPEPPTYYTVLVTNGTASAESVAKGGSVTLTANTPTDCNVFANWTITGATVSDLTQNPLTISDIQNNITATANYAALEIPTITISLASSTVYQNKSVTITATASTAVSGISYKYQYKKSDADSWTDASSATLTLSEVGTYTVRAIASFEGCDQTATSNEATLTVEEKPGVVIHANFPADWFTTYSGQTPGIHHWGGSAGGTFAMTYEATDSDGSQWYSFCVPGDVSAFKFCLSSGFDWESGCDVALPSEETCYQLYTEKSIASTVRDCPTFNPSMTLSSSEGTSLVAGTSTTITVGSSNFSGSVSYTISIDGTQVASKNTYTWTPTTVGTYTISATATDGTETLTKELQISVVQTVTVMFRLPKSTETFGDINKWTQQTPEIYMATTYTTGEYYLSQFTKIGMNYYVTDDNDYKWYTADVKEGAQIFFFDGNSGNTYQDYPYYSSSTAIVSAANECYTIENQGRNDPNRFTLTTGNCPTLSGRFRLRSETTDSRTFYSNVGTLNDTLSVYVAGRLYLEKYDNAADAWADSTELALTADLDSMLIISTYADNQFTLAPYVGDIYVRTDGANGGWVNYINDDNRMTNWAPNRSLASEYYDYYWVKWLEKNVNLKAAVANRFNQSIANELGDLVLKKAGANTRLAYDAPSNRFYRNLIGGAETNKFLEITEMKSNEQHLLFMDSLKADPVAYSGNNGRLLTDVSNWNYYIDTYCYPGAAVHMEGTQDDAGTQVLVDSLVVLKGETFPTKPYRVRLIYLFAQNRIVHAWLPDGELSDSYEIGSGVLFVREDDSLINSLSMAQLEQAKVVAERIYLCLEINKSNWQQKKAVSQQAYFFSLPYTCKIEDIYGSFDKTHYGSKWIIQRYRGDKRAQYGLTADANYWATMKPTATLEANRGYVLLTNFQESDFKDAKGVSRLRFYFPSIGTDFIFKFEDSATSELESYPCTINIPDSLIEYGNGDRRALDNDWHVFGIPGFVPMTIDNVNLGENAAPNYVYKYTMRSTADADPSSQYTLYSTAGGFAMKPFYSYFVQFAGTVNWSAYTSVSPHNSAASAPALAPSENMTEQYLLTLTNTANAEDHMYITLSDDGSDDIVSNRDMLKMLSTGRNFPQIYALNNREKFGAIDLARESQTIPLGIYFGTDGNYTIALSTLDDYDISSVMLYDKTLNQYCDLLQGDYTFTATTGSDEARFEVSINRKSGISTETPNIGENSGACVFAYAGQLVAANLADGDQVRLYDAVGRLLTTEHAAGGQVRFSSLNAGIYLLTIETKDGISTQKIVVE
jgi:hypothetical protein